MKWLHEYRDCHLSGPYPGGPRPWLCFRKGKERGSCAHAASMALGMCNTSGSQIANRLWGATLGDGERDYG